MKILLYICCGFCLVGCSSQKLIVTQVISADTVILNNGKQLKYAGVEAPPKDNPWFEAARAANEFLVLNHKVTLIKEPSLSTDQQITAYVYTPIQDEKSQKQLFVNAELVRFGYARAAKNKQGISNLKLWKNLQDVEEKEAKFHKIGIWSNQIPPKTESNP